MMLWWYGEEARISRCENCCNGGMILSRYCGDGLLVAVPRVIKMTGLLLNSYQNYMHKYGRNTI